MARSGCSRKWYTEVSGRRRVRGTPRLDWMYVSKVALSSREMTAKAADKARMIGRVESTGVNVGDYLGHVCLLPAFMLNRPSKLGWLIPWCVGGRPLHEAVGINCNNGSTANHIDI